MIPQGVMLNAYPDSCGSNLAAAVQMLQRDEFSGVFHYFYILPSMFQSDLDRGFSVISYDLNDDLVKSKDLDKLRKLGLELKLDFVLNHLSVASPQFQSLLERGDDSPFVDAFIDWNKFWAGQGTMGSQGYILPDEDHLSKLFMRKPGLPILRVPFPDGSHRFYWNTFYQSVSVSVPKPDELTELDGIDSSNSAAIAGILQRAIEEGIAIQDAEFGEFSTLKDAVTSFVYRRCTRYLGQMDLNAGSDAVWDFYKDTFKKLAFYGARIVRLDAFAYLHKEIGASNFFNEPGTWEYLEGIRKIAEGYGIVLLPEIHSKYEDGIHEKLAQRGYYFYDFFFPALVINAIESGSGQELIRWIDEIRKRGFCTVNMLGSHDGIPVLDVKGMLDESAINSMVNLLTQRGGRVKDLYGPDGKEISYYQVNATFFSALGENEKKLLLARAIQIFMPGIPEVWYLDIFAGTNDTEAADRGGHKEINRSNLTETEIEKGLERPIVQKQLALLRFRNQFEAFGDGSELSLGPVDSGKLLLTWVRNDFTTTLDADLKNFEFQITYREGEIEGQLEL